MFVNSISSLNVLNSSKQKKSVSQNTQNRSNVSFSAKSFNNVGGVYADWFVELLQKTIAKGKTQVDNLISNHANEHYKEMLNTGFFKKFATGMSSEVMDARHMARQNDVETILGILQKGETPIDAGKQGWEIKHGEFSSSHEYSARSRELTDAEEAALREDQHEYDTIL